jgi:hypothetical protein
LDLDSVLVFPVSTFHSRLALIDKHKFLMRDNATDHERSKFIAFECSNLSGTGIEAILMESVRQKRALAKSQATPQPTKK